MSTVSVSPPPVTLQGATVGAAAGLFIAMGPPVAIAAQPAGPLAKPGCYVITAPGLAIELDAAARYVRIKDLTGTATIAASVDGDPGGARFLSRMDAMDLVWSGSDATWWRF